jgi:hypothetical protein
MFYSSAIFLSCACKPPSEIDISIRAKEVRNDSLFFTSSSQSSHVFCPYDEHKCQKWTRIELSHEKSYTIPVQFVPSLNEWEIFLTSHFLDVFIIHITYASLEKNALKYIHKNQILVKSWKLFRTHVSHKFKSISLRSISQEEWQYIHIHCKSVKYGITTRKATKRMLHK